MTLVVDGYDLSDPFERKVYEYFSSVKRYQKYIDAWYTVAELKFSEGDGEGQDRAYDEIDKLYEKLNALVNPLESEVPENPEDLNLKLNN